MKGFQRVHPRLTLEAWQVSASELDAIAAWCGGRAGDVEQVVDFHSSRDTMATAEVGDWVVNGPSGFFAVRDEFFHLNYVPDDELGGGR